MKLADGATRAHAQLKFVRSQDLLSGRKVFKFKGNERMTVSFRHHDLPASHYLNVCRWNRFSRRNVLRPLRPYRFGPCEAQVEQIGASIMSSDVQRKTFSRDY